ncbi:zf-TFIIB domain-containing protein [Paracoccus sp. (in: a-proteobacteria)]|uniref:TFIIB-type zinc ribbon-containing protein n=1 Tax=Paracoccus sp. TaxID=267 RepID=UPI00289E558D|nr:zf-TFIIB domain-containing protein [Paracoccus sp. (in: a-proteobacteria)]
MQCPIDGETLAMSQRNGVEIDYCPKCRGVWLDRGELDKILERAAAESAPIAAPRHDGARSQSDGDHHRENDRRFEDRRFDDRRSEERRDDRHDRDDYRRYDDDYGHGKKKKRESFLSDLFDF